MDLVEQFRYFLGSKKVSEGLNSELRPHVTVRTGLETALVAALAEGRDVVVAGSAGGGKTHLLETISELDRTLPKMIRWPEEPEPPREQFLRVVPDATALPSSQRQRMMSPRPRNCAAVAIAINEGPLLDLKRSRPQSSFAGAVEFLHAGQRGLSPSLDRESPVVIDVGGFDPVEAGVVAELMRLPLLADLVDATVCECEDPRVCPRRLAWKMLKSDTVRVRLNELLRVVSMSGRSILFRELWDFVADLAMGGACRADESEPPTSPWFWRVFYGSSEISTRLRSAADPSLVVFPRAEAHIWYGDWTSDSIAILPDVEFIPLPTDGRFTPEQYRWLKAELFFGTQSDSILDVIREQVDLSLVSALREQRTGELVAALNRYMSYGTQTPSQQALQLWTDLGVERRMDRAHGQVSLGEFPATDLEVRRSRAVMNHHDVSCELSGSRSFLVHDATGASLSLTPEALSLLREGRSYRSSDRTHTDMEWHISRFYIELATALPQSNRLEVMQLDFAQMASRVRSYRVSKQLGQIEPLGAP